MTDLPRCFECSKDMSGQRVKQRSIFGDPICEKCLAWNAREQDPMARFDDVPPLGDQERAR